MRSTIALRSLLIGAITFSYSDVAAAVDLASLCPAADIGKFKCVSDTQFVLCNGARTVVQNMGQGVMCHENAIQAGGKASVAASSPVVSSPAASSASSSLITVSVSSVPQSTQSSVVSSSSTVDTRATRMATSSPFPTLTPQSSSSVVPQSTQGSVVSSLLTANTKATVMATSSPSPTPTQLSSSSIAPKSATSSVPYNGIPYNGTYNCDKCPTEKCFGKSHKKDVVNFLFCVGNGDQTDAYTYCNGSDTAAATYNTTAGMKCFRRKDKSCYIT